MTNTSVRTEVWETLSVSDDVGAELAQIYPAEFYLSFAERFNRAPSPFELIHPVETVVRNYLHGKWQKAAERSKLLKYSGAHMISAGVAARQVSRSLKQIAKSDLANAMISNHLPAVIGAKRPFAEQVHQKIARQLGPEKRLQHIEELCAALSEAIGEIIPLPDDDEDAKNMTGWSFDFVDEVNAAHEKTLSKNHAVELAAICFRSTWEAHSTLKYHRGRYKFERGDYDSPPADALFAILTKLDSTIAPSLVGTAIENIRKQSIVE